MNLHALSVRDCPFDRRLDTTVPEAARAVAAGLVDETDFDEERAGRTAVDLLAELDEAAAQARHEEFLDLAVCHGDACLHVDLALLARSMSTPGLNPGYGPVLADRMLSAYPVDVDPWRLEFYQLLDEFF